jgi:hypothetical protein
MYVCMYMYMYIYIYREGHCISNAFIVFKCKAKMIIDFVSKVNIQTYLSVYKDMHRIK